MRPCFLLLLAPFALAACRNDPGEPYLFGFGSPERAGALNAPWDFGRTGQLAGRPAEAALAAFRVEQQARSVDTEPLWQAPGTSLLQPQLHLARRQMREALGIAPDVPPEAAETALYRATLALRAGDRGAAAAALSAPGFTLGGAGTLARLDNLPRLRLVDEAAQAVAQAANPSGRSARPGIL
ncbi:hypothetical protein [Roseomonas sp. BN140053]|uniref:hypothetical protein n=1 Tax=Roseomonas sp. BN140053 TaxID=3391898 RepID=UPI0039EB7AF9